MGSSWVLPGPSGGAPWVPLWGLLGTLLGASKLSCRAHPRSPPMGHSRVSDVVHFTMLRLDSNLAQAHDLYNYRAPLALFRPLSRVGGMQHRHQMQMSAATSRVSKCPNHLPCHGLGALTSSMPKNAPSYCNVRTAALRGSGITFKHGHCTGPCIYSGSVSLHIQINRPLGRE